MRLSILGRRFYTAYINVPVLLLFFVTYFHGSIYVCRTTVVLAGQPL